MNKRTLFCSIVAVWSVAAAWGVRGVEGVQ